MRKLKGCNEEDEAQMVHPGSSLQERIWEAQAGERELIINGGITDNLIELIVMQIQNINKVDAMNEAAIRDYERDPITIYISSAGGELHTSFAVISAIEASATPVITVALGSAMSGGFLILLAGHQRYAQRYATLMYHELSSGVGGKATDVREYSEHLEFLQDQIKDYVYDRTAITEEQLDDCHIRKADWYMDVFEAIDLGVVDGVWPPDVFAAEESDEVG